METFSLVFWQLNIQVAKTLILMIATLAGTPWFLYFRIARTPAMSIRLPLIWRWQSEWQWYSRPATVSSNGGGSVRTAVGVKLPWGGEQATAWRLPRLSPAHGVSRTNSVHYISDRQHGDSHSLTMIKASGWIGGQMCFAHYLGNNWVLATRANHIKVRCPYE